MMRKTLQTQRTRGSHGLIGRQTGLRYQMHVLSAVAPRETTVLVCGESGTGKELLAREIHARSKRSAGPFVPVDCTTVTGSLFESQLFGHVKGAFTGASTDTLGLIRSADGGTLFLDEVGELRPELQGKLLRVLQDRLVLPVGGVQPFPADIRVIAATNCSLEAMVHQGAFREDLYYRLAVVCLQLPPLRQRPEDIGPLAYHFLDAIAAFYQEPGKRFTRRAVAALRAYRWPGNVRELANAIERAFVLCSDETIDVDALPGAVRGSTAPADSDHTLDAIERGAIEEAMRETGWIRSQAAAILGIDPRRLKRMMARLHVSAPGKGAP
ncbi:MAG: sigma-54-dependent Fis family transcriptional regulator [Phycisphaerae bacterium]|nr:sigma-54-dependent Fis family transcriptional regulator [Phycisphaerae bacterium]